MTDRKRETQRQSNIDYKKTDIKKDRLTSRDTREVAKTLKSERK